VATREEKVQQIDELKSQIERTRDELEALIRKRRRRQLIAGLFRTGIVLLAVSVGIGVVAVLLN